MEADHNFRLSATKHTQPHVSLLDVTALNVAPDTESTDTRKTYVFGVLYSIDSPHLTERVELGLGSTR